MKKYFFIHTLITGLFLSLSIQAGDAVLSFEELDGDSDGYIAESEAKVSKNIAKNFKKVDTDKDGKISITEFQYFMGKDLLAPPEGTEIEELGAAPY